MQMLGTLVVAYGGAAIAQAQLRDADIEVKIGVCGLAQSKCQRHARRIFIHWVWGLANHSGSANLSAAVYAPAAYAWSVNRYAQHHRSFRSLDAFSFCVVCCVGDRRKHHLRCQRRCPNPAPACGR